MSTTKPIGRVAIIGTGVIGASWTALFLAKGLEVIATDIAPNAETSLRSFVKPHGRRSTGWALPREHHNRVSRSHQTFPQPFALRTSSRKAARNASTSSRTYI